MNHLETKLTAWVPRRPSDKLRRRIFSEKPVETAEDLRGEPRLGWMGWLTPVTAAAAVIASTMGFTGLPIQPAQAGETNRAVLAALTDRCQQSTWNHVGVETFKWTNSMLPPSTNASLNSVN